MAEEPADGTQSSLQKIKNQLSLSSSSASVLMEGSLLKRSETLRKWNQRWFTLDPTTGKMEYRVQQGDATPRGLIAFDADSTITISPINFNGAKKYDGCCFYVGAPQKKEYFLCAETPGAARAWVATLRAAALVLKAHKEAVDSLSGNGHAKLGTVAAVVAAANATAREGVKEMHLSMKAALKPHTPQRREISADDVATVLKETLRVKDEELNQLAGDLRARDYTIREMADRLSETAEAAEAAASAAHSMDKERKMAKAELQHLRNDMENRLHQAARELRGSSEALAMSLKARDSALQEAQRWRVELAKGREQHVLMEAAVVRAEDSAKRAVAEAEENKKIVREREAATLAAKDEVVQLAKHWQTQADYYQAQAARYLSLLQKSEVPHEKREQTAEVTTTEHHTPDCVTFDNLSQSAPEVINSDISDMSPGSVPNPSLQNIVAMDSETMSGRSCSELENSANSESNCATSSNYTPFSASETTNSLPDALSSSDSRSTFQMAERTTSDVDPAALTGVPIDDICATNYLAPDAQN